MIKNIEKNNENVAINDKEIAVLREYFPACFKNDGSFDIERFKEQLKDKVDVIHEGYELKFLGKSYAKLLASIDTTTVITPNTEHNNLPENANSENIYISGDNLDGLKHLLKSYAKTVKCIYIDPPYNTGSDGFVYKDNFNFNSNELQEKLSLDETQANRILELTKKGSASHSAWLMFMYSRLQLAKDLLTDDGVIFISIDDNEQANLKLLCNDVFGEENFITELVWKKKQGGGNDSKNFVIEHEYIIGFAKSINKVNINLDEDYVLSDSLYPLKDENGEYGLITLDKSSIQFSQSLVFEITDSNGNKYTPRIIKGKQSCWRWGKNKVEEEFDKLVFKNGKVYTKYYRPEGVIAKSLLIDSRFGRTETGQDDIKAIFEEAPFSYPKPIKLIQHLLKLLTKKNDIVLDFFSGSATTAHSLIFLNSLDKGNRKFITVQLPELLNIKNSIEKNAFDFLKSLNHPTTLDYIGYERIKRAAKKIKEENNLNIDYGFKHYILNEPNPSTLDKCESFDKASLLGDGSILEDFGLDTILVTWLNYDGYGLITKAEEIDLKGYKGYYLKKHLYLIDTDFTQESVMALFEKYDNDATFNPENIILFGYSFNEWSVTEMLEKNLKILNDTEKNLKINIEVRY